MFVQIIDGRTKTYTKQANSENWGPPLQGLITRFKLSKYKSKVTVKVTRSKVWYQLKGLVIRNTHVKYKGPTSNRLKVMIEV